MVEAALVFAANPLPIRRAELSQEFLFGEAIDRIFEFDLKVTFFIPHLILRAHLPMPRDR